MRILVFIHEYPPLGGGGGRAAQDICKGLVRRGHEVVAITARMRGLPKRELDEGVQVIRLWSFRREAFMAGFITMLAFMGASFLKGIGWIRRWKPDVIHAQFAVPAGPVAWTLTRFNKIPYVLSSHLGDIPGGVPDKTAGWFRWLYWLTPMVWKQAAAAVAVSEFTRQLALEHYGVPIRVIPNGAEVRSLDEKEIKLGSPLQIVFAGRFVYQKNPAQVVRVLTRLADLPWRCVMMGDGEKREEVIRLIEQAGLEERFELPGWVDPEVVLATFRESDILFMPSRVEGLPVVGVQAISEGLAVVAGRAGGFIDLVKEGKNGFLYDPEDTDGIAGGLRKLLSDQAMLLAARTHSLKVAQRFGIDTIVGEYEAVFKEVVAGGR